MRKLKESVVSLTLISSKKMNLKEKIRFAKKDDEHSRQISYKKDFLKNKQLYLMLMPYMFLFTLFVIIPIVAAFLLSFTSYNMFQMPRFIGMKNYTTLFVDDSVFFIAVKNTFVFALFTGPISYFLCFVFAWLINDLPKCLRVIMTVVFYAPSLGGSAFFIWQYIFSGDAYGIINSFLMNLGYIDEPVQWLSNESTNLIVLMIVQIWMSLGTSFLAFIAGFQGVDRSLYEAAYVDGVHNRWQELIYITFPMLKPQLLFSAIMQIVNSFSVSSISSTLCGFPSTNYSAHTIVLHIQDYGTIRYEMGYACAISVLLFVTMLLIRRLIDFLLRYIPDT